MIIVSLLTFLSNDPLPRPPSLTVPWPGAFNTDTMRLLAMQTTFCVRKPSPANLEIYLFTSWALLFMEHLQMPQFDQHFRPKCILDCHRITLLIAQLYFTHSTGDLLHHGQQGDEIFCTTSLERGRTRLVCGHQVWPPFWVWPTEVGEK